MRIWAVCWSLALALGALGCSSKDQCVERMEEVEGCGLQYKDDAVCEAPSGQCRIDCDYQAGCRELTRLLDGAEPPDAYRRCVAQCDDPFQCDLGATTISARWRCDGEADCHDHTDERDCTYHECANGELVREGARCDGYEHCADGSDEDGC